MGMCVCIPRPPCRAPQPTLYYWLREQRDGRVGRDGDEELLQEENTSSSSRWWRMEDVAGKTSVQCYTDGKCQRQKCTVEVREWFYTPRLVGLWALKNGK